MFHAAISPSTRREHEEKKDFTIVRSHCANNNAQLIALDNLRLSEHETTEFSQVRSTENTYTKLKWPFLFFFLRAPLSHNHSYRTSSSTFDLTRHDYSGSTTRRNPLDWHRLLQSHFSKLPVRGRSQQNGNQGLKYRHRMTPALIQLPVT